MMEIPGGISGILVVKGEGLEHRQWAASCLSLIVHGHTRPGREKWNGECVCVCAVQACVCVHACKQVQACVLHDCVGMCLWGFTWRVCVIMSVSVREMSPVNLFGLL